MQIRQEYTPSRTASWHFRVSGLTTHVRSPVVGCISSIESVFCCKFPYHLAALRSTSDLTRDDHDDEDDKDDDKDDEAEDTRASRITLHHLGTFRCAIAIFRSAACRSHADTCSSRPTTRVTVRLLRKLQLLL